MSTLFTDTKTGVPVTLGLARMLSADDDDN